MDLSITLVVNTLQSAGLKLGLVTSNTRANVTPATVVNAVGSKQQPGFTAVLCAIGAVLAAIFIALDTRNQYLLRLAEEVLCHLEENAIFGKGTTIKDRDGEGIRFGILSRQLSEERSGKGPPKIIRHRYLLRLVGVLMLVSFVIAGIWIYLRPQ